MLSKQITFILVEILMMIESTILIDNLTARIVEEPITENCRNPDKNYLDMIYSDYLSLYRRYEEKLFQKEIQPENQDSEKQNENSDLFAKNEINEKELRKKFFERTQCDLNDRNR